MKKLILLILICSISLNSFSQRSAYFPDGTKINIKFSCAKDLLDSLHIIDYDADYQQNADIYYKKNSNKPLFVIFFNGSGTVSQINQLVASYNKKYDDYINSNLFYYDINELVKKGSLNKKYLSYTFGEPDKKTGNEDGSENWSFEKYNLEVKFRNDSILNFTLSNYKAISKNALSIINFNVTGSDYSIGFNISVMNISNKIIKYIFITITATNAVEDVVDSKIVKGVGPIPSFEIGRYEFENAIISNTAQFLAIDNIKLQYMDGTYKSIPKSEINKIKIRDRKIIEANEQN